MRTNFILLYEYIKEHTQNGSALRLSTFNNYIKDNFNNDIKGSNLCYILNKIIKDANGQIYKENRLIKWRDK